MSHKPTLVILPGWGGSHETWQEFIALASTHFGVLCIDLPCFGDAPCPQEVWGVEDYADYVKEKLDKSVDKKIILLGHSFGGQVATCFAAKYPEYIDKLILSGAAVIRPNKIFRRVFFGSLAKIGHIIFRLPVIEKFDVFAKKLLYRIADSPDYSATAGMKKEIYKRIIREDYRHVLPNIKLKTLVTWGDRDRMTPIKHGKQIVDLLPKSEIHIFPGIGHGIHREATKAFVDVVDNFVKA